MTDLVRYAMTLLIVFVALSLIVGGSRGGRWAVSLILTPVRNSASAHIRAVVYMLVGIIVLYYLGVNTLVH